MAVRLKQWLAQFCAWHDQYRKGEIVDEDLPRYREARAELIAVLIVAQRLEIRTDGARQALRMARAMQLELDLPTGRVTALTQDISTGGLSALVGSAPPVGAMLSFRLKLGRGGEPVAGRARVVAASPTNGSVRMAIAFEDIDQAARDHIEDLILDAICVELRAMCRAGHSEKRPAA